MRKPAEAAAGTAVLVAGAALGGCFAGFVVVAAAGGFLPGTTTPFSRI
jgi:hypothetical protein